MVLLLLVVRAVVPVAELNRSDIAGTEAEPPQLVRAGALGFVPGINRLTGLKEREMPVARPAVVPEGGETGIARAIGGLEGNTAPRRAREDTGRVANEIIPEGGHRTNTIGTFPKESRIERHDRVLERYRAANTTATGEIRPNSL